MHYIWYDNLARHLYSKEGKMESSKKIVWYNLAFMAFSTVWGFGNVLNGFVYFNGVQVIFSWVLMFALYFVPYALNWDPPSKTPVVESAPGSMRRLVQNSPTMPGGPTGHVTLHTSQVKEAVV